MKLRNRFAAAMLALGLISAPATLSAGSVNPANTTTSVNAHSRDRFQAVVFRAGEAAEVAVSGDGDTDLDLYVYDESGNLVARDEDDSDECFVRFYPRWTGRFYIVVMNRGSVYNRYHLVSN